jgi:cell division protein ZapB
MNSDFQQLSKKIDQLAELTKTLRQENAALRLQLTASGADVAACREKMHQAEQRIMALLAQLPLPPEPEPELADEAENIDIEEACA